jgi:peroxiredoxin Q/BCP
MTVAIGDRAPDFKLPRDGGGSLSLKELRGRKVVVYFYPKDDTSGCTKEGEAFRDAYKAFGKAGTEIVGISRDSVKKHDAFKAKYGFPFPLVSDEEGAACEAFGVWVEKSMYGRKYMGIERATFLLDEKGVIREVWHKVKVPGHADAVLQAAQAL